VVRKTGEYREKDKKKVVQRGMQRHLAAIEGLHGDGIRAKVGDLAEDEALLQVRSPDLLALIHA
jgi:hypothetical protein